LALINLLVTAVEILVWPDVSLWLLVPVNFAVMIVLVLLWSKLFKLGWGRVNV
jgi:hypothetical protein